MSSPEGDKGGNAIRERRAQDVEATDDIIVHGTHPSFGVIWLSLLLSLRQEPFLLRLSEEPLYKIEPSPSIYLWAFLVGVRHL